MINITVHHHTHQPLFATCLPPSAVTAAAASPIRQHNQQQQSSKVEVQCSGPQIIPQSISHRLTRETLVDANNNNNNENFDFANLKVVEARATTKQQQRYSKTDQDIDTRSEMRNKQNNNNNLHTRSISLIVNPEFSSSDSESELALSRRRTLPRLIRRTRLLLTTEVQNQRQQQPEGQQTQLVPDEPDFMGQAATFAGGEVDDDEDATVATLKQLQAESCARLRETGAFLRQISDEFSKARRRTI